MCEPRLWNSLIQRFEASSDVLQQRERALNIRERLPYTGERRRSTQNSDRGSFDDSLALAEEGFSGLNRCLIWLHVVGVVSLLMRVSRGEMSLSVRIRMSSTPQHPRAHTQAALQAQLEAQQAQVPAPQADHGGPSIMERFKRMSPPYFKWESDPLLAESWMMEIEKIFRAIRCAEDDKVTLATYMLQERADVWCSSLLRTRFEDGAVEVLSAVCRKEGEMEQYLEEKKASQKRPAAPFQR
ncbi:hypothetical protein Taro_052177 [Colocasia esculenta]|uniref:Retrotransposon gag domain-containing protein n=1 Tax=Colocasia esculenta TaxID=4460 RepID=A0A843XJG1_COLES|nr:hypothetical protein [Colocasia esculenta]